MKAVVVRPAEKIFQTFCHINEYGKDGFANLHRMIAASEPLVLWAPSSQLLATPECRVGKEEFIEYVENGRVRIVGRRTWLTDKAARNDPLRMSWPGARWDSYVDGAIEAIAREDENLDDDEQKRVLIATDERGPAYATSYLEQFPSEVSRLSSLLETAEALQRLPEGLLDRLKRTARKQQAASASPAEVVTRLLSDVFNHGEAIQLAGADAPFFLAPRESTFLTLLDESLRTGVSQPVGARPPAGPKASSVPLSADDYAALTREVLAVLEALDKSRRNSLKGFVAGDGHAALSQWYREVCCQLEQQLPEFRAGRAIRELQAKHDAGDLNVSPKELIASIGGATATLGLSLSIADWAVQSTISGLGIAGLSAGLIGSGYEALRSLGYARVKPAAPEWPFLYAVGGRPTRHQYDAVSNVLDRLMPSS